MQTLNDMLAQKFLTPDQHFEILSWTTHAKTPEKIMDMPPHLWRSLELASVLMGFEVGPATL
ncbi:hypothetical protein [Roseateles sp.]|uniref:hypothetical protein n=1 Tax=Roseateles sp. TaxID=1971397 RepID=UPI00286CC751|nr:hypothetical protein [Roseateles sp.]